MSLCIVGTRCLGRTTRSVVAPHTGLTPLLIPTGRSVGALPNTRPTCRSSGSEACRATAESLSVCVKVAGLWRYLYRAIDQFGQVVDVWLSPRRDAIASRRFFATAMKATGLAG
jgi:hypothetical protein